MNFNAAIDRKNTGSRKWDAVPINPDAIPMWVADMDFACPTQVMEAMRQRCSHPVFGYSLEPEEFRRSIAHWQKTRHGWDIGDSHVMANTSVVPALYCAVRAFTQPGDQVLIMRPLYGPFTLATENQGRVAVSANLLETPNGWEIDFEALERLAAQPKTKMMFLCNPHNPVGRVYTRQELERIYEICQNYGLVLCVDEIHADFVYPGHTHVPMGSLHTKGVLTMASPSKTFNLASVRVSYVICGDEELWEKFSRDAQYTGLDTVSIFGHIATAAAYTHGADYVDEMMAHLEKNVDILEQELKTIPQIRFHRPQGTYLMWLNCRSLGMHNQELVEFFAWKAGVAFTGGTFFGPEGDGFVRMNLACTEATLRRALRQIRKALAE